MDTSTCPSVFRGMINVRASRKNRHFWSNAMEEKRSKNFNSESVKYHACSLFLQQSDIHWLKVMCGRTFLLGLIITSDVHTITICDRQFRLFWNNPSTKFRNRMVINIQFGANCAVFVDESACCNRGFV